MRQGRVQLIAGNWKMNGSRASALALARELAEGVQQSSKAEERQWLVCPPFVHLDLIETCFREVFAPVSGVSQALGVGERPIALGAQNVAGHKDGAFTGEVSASMLVEAGCRWVLIGHSERRTLQAETNEQISAKLQRARDAGLSSVVCVGESWAEREGGQSLAVIGAQLEAILPILRTPVANVATSPEIAIAYEPIWAIGTGRSASAELAQEVHAAIRSWFASHDLETQALRILYGGSVKAANAASLLAMPDIDGVLVGGASLIASEFLGIGGLSSRS